MNYKSYILVTSRIKKGIKQKNMYIFQWMKKTGYSNSEYPAPFLIFLNVIIYSEDTLSHV